MFIIMTATAKMPNSCWGRYMRVAVVETDGTRPKMISERARGVVRIVQTWERRNASTRGPNTAFARATREAADLVAKLNGEQ